MLDNKKYSNICSISALSLIGALAASETMAAEEVKADEAAKLEKITVTARKTEESLQDTPVAVTAIMGDAIELNSIKNLEDLKSIPGVSLDSGGLAPGVAFFSIRGLSTTNADPTFESAIATVVDGVYYAKTGNAVMNLFDIETVEILRGPQGSLFGRNTPAGVVNVKTRRPGEEFSAKIDATYSSFNTTDLRFAADIPLIEDKLYSRFAIMKRDSDGPFTNEFTGAEDPNQEDLLIGRASFNYIATDNLEATLILESVDSEGTGGNAKNLSGLTDSITWVADASGMDMGAATSDNPTKFNSDGTALSPSDAKTASIEVHYDLGDLTFTSVTGYRDESNHFEFDVDSTPLRILQSDQNWISDQITQELRVSSNYDGNFNFILGAFYMDADYFKDQVSDLSLGMIVGNIAYNGAYAGAISSGASEDAARAIALQAGQGTAASFGPAAVHTDITVDQNTVSQAIFGEVYYDFAENWSLTLGGRYSSDEKDFSYNFIEGPVSDIIVPLKESWSNFSPKVGLDWKIDSDTLAYATWSNGFRAGGFNGRANSVIVVETPYGEENAEALELGFKTELFESQIRLNVAAHYTEYTDLQVEANKTTPNGVDLFTVNAGASTVKGIEIEMVALLTPELIMTSDIAYMDAEYDSFFADLNGDGVETDNTALTVPYSPEWKTHIGLTYEIELADYSALTFNIDWTYTTPLELETVNVPGVTERSATHIVDASINWFVTDELRFSLFGKNLADEVYFVDVGVNDGWGAFGAYSNPRSFGASVSYEF